MRASGAERLPNFEDEGYEAPETYARSLATIRIAGAAALKGELTPAHGAYEALWKDWDSGLAEMIKISPELGSNLEISRVDSFELRDGVAVDNNGQPMTQVVGRAKRISAAMAEKDLRILTQYNRDASDEHNMLCVDAMTKQERPTYNTRLVLSMHPEEAIAKDGKRFWQDPQKGFFYINGMAFLQLYHAPHLTDEEGQSTSPRELVTGSYSVDHGSKAIWLEVLEEFGLHIPEGESTDNFVRYGLEMQLTTEQALELPQAMRRRYYEKRQARKQRLSINEFMDAHRPVTDQYFEQLYIPMAEALVSGEKNDILHVFVEELYKKPELFSSEVLQGMMRILNRQLFDAADARLVEDLIRYGAAESLRLSLKSYALGEKVTPTPVEYAYVTPDCTMDLLRNMVDHIHDGTENHRVYVACGALSDFSSSGGRDGGASNGARNGSEIFGGNASASEEASIPDNIRCIKCAKFSKKEDVVGKDRWCCPKCDYAIDICTGKELSPSRAKDESSHVIAKVIPLFAEKSHKTREIVTTKVA